MFSLSYRTMILPAGLALLVAACGDDGGDSNTPDANNDNTPDASQNQLCPDHPNVTEQNGVCAISAGDNDPITEDLTLTADADYLLDGPVFVGDDAAETVLTIEPGVTIFGGDGSFLLIQRGSKIMAEGTAANPIVMTSAKDVGSRTASDWGGLVINGRAPINNGNAQGEAPGEAGTGTYGGDMPTDNSGVIKYVRVEFAGNKVDAENELNGIAFQGVGSGTEVDYIQTHMTSDDGVEFFGGTVNVKHLVVTGADDDSVDWTGGWAGKVQFVIVEQLAESGPEAERGIEADNLEANNSAEPYSDPTLSNFTFIARTGNDAEGVRFRRGTKGELHNSIITGFGGVCINATDAQTETNITAGDLVVANLVLNCTGGAASAGASTELVDGAHTTDDAMLNGWIPMAGSPALGIGAGPADEFFDTVDYAGAFDGTTNWADGWIETAVE